ncbi:fibronectin type III domain-containing protein [Candidatus Dojkabacteria bacterium]|nr:fibronectin type III domain-containing protein [Candidatus Dojkabacteria bacterium]
MKKAIFNSLKLVVVLASALQIFFLGKVYAQEEITSPSFRIVTPTINSGTLVSSSTNYYFYSALGEISDPKLMSSSYSIGAGTPSTYIANVPLITCFETNTDSANSQCNTSYPNQNGTKGEAGEGGFYDRAKIVIDTQNNPTDALYGIQISTDNFTTIQYIDGVTRQAGTAKSIANFLTKDQWESFPWDSANIIGLSPNTEYQVRLTALHGDLTESPPSPSVNATTQIPSIAFDIDISGDTWPNPDESAAPYSIALGTLTPGEVITAPNRIYLDLGSNIISGISTYISDLNDGLLSNSASNTIPSPSVGNPTTVDLSTVSEGFGIKISNINSTTPSSLVRNSNYYNASIQDQVGRLRSTGTDTILTTSSGIYAGRAQIEVKATASFATPPADDYSDNLVFTVISNF